MIRNALVPALAAALAITACDGRPPVPPAATPVPAGPSQSGATPAEAPGAVGGVVWHSPERWVREGDRPMRAASYRIPGEAATAGDGECAVFYFGDGAGGDVQANIDRWSQQFEGAPEPETRKAEGSPLPVTVVEIDGTYLAPGGPMMTSQGRREGYRLLGAIVEAPQGPVFFKCTGPAPTLAAARPDFEALIASLRTAS